MQNFTFGRKGHNWFLFAFILFVGSLSSIYGQCPTVNSSSQEYCGLDQVSDLQVTDPDPTDGNTIRWYDSQTSTDPIPQNENLENGKTYYAGYQNGGCTNQRAEVTVSITTPGAPQLAQGEDEFFTPCDINGNHTVADLKAGIDFQDQTGYSLEYFDNQFNESTPLADNFQLVEGNSYFAGFVDDNDQNCQSNRTAIKYDPVKAPAPSAVNQQSVCEGTTVSELDAEGTNRWYRTATSQPPLANDFIVENGRTYYVTQIIPSDGPPCESEERTAVTVTIIDPDPGTDNSQTLCENEVEDNGYFDNQASLETYFINLLGASDNDGSFDPELSTLITNYNDGIDSPEEVFETVYTVSRTATGGEVCKESATATLIINKAEAPQTGTIADQSYCTNDGVQDLYALLESSANPNGVFNSPDADVVDGKFDPESEGPGTYTITYTVSPSTACVTGTADTNFEIEVNQSPNAGPGGEFTFCQEEFETLLATILANPAGQGVELLNEIDPTIDAGGTFSNNNLTTIAAAYDSNANATQTFTTTYEISNSNCTDSATYTVIITPNQQSNAGDDDEVTLCVTDEERTLESFLSQDAMEGGEFKSDDFDVTTGVFNPATEGVGTYVLTYIVDGSEECVEGNDEANIEITVEEAPNAGSTNSTVLCTENLDDNPFGDADDLRALYLSLLEEGVATDGTFDPSMSEIISDYNDSDGTGEFITTYTVGDECKASVELTVEVKDNIEASLSEVVDPDPICQNAGIQELTNFIGSNQDFGRFEGYPEGIFDPGVEGEGTYTIVYIVDEETPCVTGSSSISFDITVEPSAFAGNGTSFELCTDQNPEDLFERLNSLDDNANTNGTFSYQGNTLENGIFDPSEFTPGTYEVNYSVDSINNCGSDESVFTITVVETPDAGEGKTTPVEVCGNLESFDLFTLLESGISTDGNFILDGSTIANGQITPADLTPNTYDVLYTLKNGTNDACTDSASFTLVVTDAANAGESLTLAACTNDPAIDLFVVGISNDADNNGEFTFTNSGEVIENGILIPSEFTADTYSITYTVPATDDCGNSTSEITFVVSETPDAPIVTGDPFNFCAIDGATGADLSATGSNLTFYLDAELTMMVMAEDPLASGTYYVTQRSEDNGCESDPTAFTVSINDAATPTITNPTLEFCEFDDPIIADLTAQINESGTITWYDSADGVNALSEGTALQDGVTYFATLFDVNTGCESSVRLSVQVTIGGVECELFIPDGFSPNGDLINDTFDLKNIRNLYPNFTITIRNRYGDVVYQGNANTPDWDGFSTEGSFGDNLLPVGAYFYYLDFRDGTTEPIRGTVYLSR